MITFKNNQLIKRDEFQIFGSEAYKIVNSYNLKKYYISVEISKRCKRVAGNISVKHSTKEVKINVSYDYYKEFGFTRIMGTLRHEFAHLISYDNTGNLDHSDNFKKICKELGGTMNPQMAGNVFSDSASSEYIRGSIKTYSWLYTCRCGSTMKREKRISEKKRTNPFVVCSKCKTSLNSWKEEKIFNK